MMMFAPETIKEINAIQDEKTKLWVSSLVADVTTAKDILGDALPAIEALGEKGEALEAICVRIKRFLNGI